VDFKKRARKESQKRRRKKKVEVKVFVSFLSVFMFVPCFEFQKEEGIKVELEGGI